MALCVVLEVAEAVTFVEGAIVYRSPGSFTDQAFDLLSVAHLKLCIWLQVFQWHSENCKPSRFQSIKHVLETLDWK